MSLRPALIALIAAIAACTSHLRPPGDSAGNARSDAPRDVMPRAETQPVASPGDAADDPAIWVHPEDPKLSLIIGTDKQRAIQLYDLDGRLLQELPDGRLNNVDLREGFPLDGEREILVAATNRSNKTISLYLLDPPARRLRRVGDGVPTGFDDPYGLCLYAARDGTFYVFASEGNTGRIRQWRLRAAGKRIDGELVRTFAVGSQAEGCAADDESGLLYVAEEDVGLWKYRADPDGGGERSAVDRVGGGSGLAADLEGVAIWRGRDGRGFVVVSNQGANGYAVYRREGDNAFVGLFRIVADPAGGVDGTAETDGLDVTSGAVGGSYPDGLLVVQDGRNDPEGQRQNFKFVSWRDVAAALGLGGD